jgi:DNA-binding NarL/FixJ family response regulator
MKHKISIVDDHAIFRKGMRLILSELDTISEVTEFENGEHFLDNLQNISPEIVFMDIQMPFLNGFETTEAALKLRPELKIIAMTSDEQTASIQAMLKAGAKGYLSKDIDIEEIHEAVKNISAHKSYFSKNILVKLATSVDNQAKRTKIVIQLSARERDVLELLCKGLAVQTIAKKLFISERTIEKHKANLFLKTDTTNTLNLVLWAIHHKICEI